MSVETLYREHRAAIWGVCYRMTGCAADADDLVQATFARALERPPEDTSRPWRPWLVKVAVNMARDHLRRRRRAPYSGPWLPSPVETVDSAPLGVEDSAEGRYSRIESASFAFLMAVEALTPQQRAVLLLCDVFDYSGRETAQALGCSAGAVRTALHRARRAMATYDTQRVVPDAAHHARTLATMAQFIEKMLQGDVAAVEKLLTQDAVAINDADGAYLSALRPVIGGRKVAAFYCGLMKKQAAYESPGHFEIRTVNGLPAIVMRWDKPAPRTAPRSVGIFIVDAEGTVRGLHSIVAPKKLTGIAFESLGS